MRLSRKVLDQLPGDVAQPVARVGELRHGIVHFGVGGFHRAHQALALERLHSEHGLRDWGIVGVGVKQGDQRMRDVLVEQDFLFSVTEKDPAGLNTRIIGSIIDYRYAPDNPAAVTELLTHPDTRIVSLTITEGGYNFNQVTGEFDWSNQEMVHDVDNPQAPMTVFGYLIHSLARRRQRGMDPFTVMSCDNIQGNGDLTRQMCVAFAQRVDPKLAEWIGRTVAFPNSMVDRITPVTTGDDIQEISDRLGLTDSWPVVCEPFFQWVLEDNFPLGRPPLEKVGVQLVEEVEPYELMKLRLLNASHQALAYFGYLMGYRLVHEAVGNPLIESLLRRYMNEEARPTLRPVEGVDLDQYCDTLIQRFTNSEVKDTVARLCQEASDRIPKWLVPVIRERLDAVGRAPLAAGVVASWARYSEGTDEHGEAIEIVDNLVEKLSERAARQHEDPLAFVKDTSLFGGLADDERFAKDYLATLTSLWEKGARATLSQLLDSTPQAG